MKKLPPENLIHHIWQSKYLLKHSLKTIEGKEISVLRVGLLNTGQGPDFFDARIKIGQTIWAGNLEIHVKSSDWKKHKLECQSLTAPVVAAQAAASASTQPTTTDGLPVPDGRDVGSLTQACV